MATKTENAPDTAIAKRPARDFTDQLIEPFNQLRSEVDRLFDGFPFRMPSLRMPDMAFGAPPIEMTETNKAFKVSIELPGIDPDDIEVSFENDRLRIAGEKKSEREEDERGYRLSERTYGAFERVLRLPEDADPQKIDAKFKNGVLKVSIAKNGGGQSGRRIKIHKDS